jgi:hypothetical protein
MSSASCARDELHLLLLQQAASSSASASASASSASSASSSRRRLAYPSVSAKIFKSGKKPPEKDYPWPKNLRGDHKDLSLSFLGRFKPLPEKPKSFTLPFERPLVDLSAKIDEVILSSA